MRLEAELPVRFADWVTAELIDWGCPGVEVADEDRTAGQIRLLVYFAHGSARSGRERLTRFLDDLGDQALPHRVGPLQEVPVEDWAEGWRFAFPPIEVGERLLLTPPWSSAESGHGRVQVVLQPGMAFGTGQHPSTLLVLEGLDRILRPGSGPVLDIGCGSGVLAIAAVLLGAEQALAIDYDEDAVASARANVERNGVQDRVDVQRARFPARPAGGPWPLVLANVYSTFFRQHSVDLAAAVARGGTLFVSGITVAEAGEAERLLDSAGLEVTRAGERAEWALLEAHRR
jgi:ribosomal protein L11 methyltransferase